MVRPYRIQPSDWLASLAHLHNSFACLQPCCFLHSHRCRRPSTRFVSPSRISFALLITSEKPAVDVQADNVPQVQIFFSCPRFAAHRRTIDLVSRWIANDSLTLISSAFNACPLLPRVREKLSCLGTCKTSFFTIQCFICMYAETIQSWNCPLFVFFDIKYL